MNNINSKKTIGTTAGNQKIELPVDPSVKARLMAYHGVTNDYDLRLAIYRDMLKKQRNERHSSSNT